MWELSGGGANATRGRCLPLKERVSAFARTDKKVVLDAVEVIVMVAGSEKEVAGLNG